MQRVFIYETTGIYFHLFYSFLLMDGQSNEGPDTIILFHLYFVLPRYFWAFVMSGGVRSAKAHRQM